MESSSSLLSVHGASDYNVVAATTSSILKDSAISIDDKMLALSEALNKGAGIFNHLSKQNAYLNNVCTALADENDRLQRHLFAPLLQEEVWREGGDHHCQGAFI